MAKLREKGSEAVTDPIIHAMARHIDPVSKGIQEYIERAKRKPGVRATAYKKLEGANTDVVALLALRTVLDSVSRPRRYQTVAVRIGREIEAELRFSSFSETNGGLYAKVTQGINESPHAYRRDYRHKVLTYTANKFDVPWEEWTDPERDHVGTFLIHVMLEFTKLVELRKYKARGKGMRIDLVGTGEMLQWLEDQHTRRGLLSPKRLPMLCEPEPWTSMYGGGYLTDAMRTDLVKLRRREYRHLFNIEDMPKVFDAVNYYQRVRYRIREPVLEVAQRMWDLGLDMPKAASRGELDLPPRPAKGAPEDIRKQYKSRARDIHFKNQRNKGRRLVVNQTLDIARRVKGRCIWFPYHLDFRGRIYASTQYLSPQGADLSKALLRFNDGKPLGRQGAYWLAVHVANTYGEDKISFDERVAWTNEVSEWIVDIARDPLGNRDWHDADKPFQFLAACFEWLGYVEQGESFVSTISVELDGSCNGIQHLAAMSLDEEAGALVNLTPSETPSDIYREVASTTEELLIELNNIKDWSLPTSEPTDDDVDNKAKEVLDKVREKSRGNKSLRSLVRRLIRNPQLVYLIPMWLEHGINRSIAKRPTMILPYNGTLNSVCGYIQDYLLEEQEETKEDFFGDAIHEATNLLGSVMWAAMSEVVTGPRETMDWVAKVIAKSNEAEFPAVWKSPSGFLVVQAYPEMKSYRVKTRVGDTLYKHDLTAPSEKKLDLRRQARSAPPNVTHSFDAAMLHLVGLEMAERGVFNLMVVHDGYGTLPSDTDMLFASLRFVFVKQYSQGDLRRVFAEDVAHFAGIDPSEIEEPPPQGDLDISQVLEAHYFFA